MLVAALFAFAHTAAQAETVQFEPDTSFWGGSAFHGDPGRTAVAIDAAGSTYRDLGVRGLLLGLNAVMVVGQSAMTGAHQVGVGAARVLNDGTLDPAFGAGGKVLHGGCMRSVDDAALVGNTVVAVGASLCDANPIDNWGMVAFDATTGQLATSFDGDGRLRYQTTAAADDQSAESIAALGSNTFVVGGHFAGSTQRSYLRFDLTGKPVGLGWLANVPEQNTPDLIQVIGGDVYVAMTLHGAADGSILRLMRLGPQLEPRWSQPTLATMPATEPAACRRPAWSITAIVPEVVAGVTRIRAFGNSGDMPFTALFDPATGQPLGARCMALPPGYPRMYVKDALPSEPGTNLVALELYDWSFLPRMTLTRIRHVNGVPTFDPQFNDGTFEIATFPAASGELPQGRVADLLRYRGGRPAIVGTRFWAPNEDYDFAIARFYNATPGTWE